MRIIVCIVLIIQIFSCRSSKNLTTNNQHNEVIEDNDQQSSEQNHETNNASKTYLINTVEQYIDVFKDIAMLEMKTYGIPASITLAQGILESGSGKGRLAAQANNHFGIKCHQWDGDKIYHDDDQKQECFRKYNNAEASFRDHSEFLVTRQRYSALFQLEISDYKNWAKELKKAGYATDRKYPDKLISLIERYDLDHYDQIVLRAGFKDLGSTSNDTFQYKVIKGDTLYSISKKHDMSVYEIKKLNKLDGDNLAIGQILQIKFN